MFPASETEAWEAPENEPGVSKKPDMFCEQMCGLNLQYSVVNRLEDTMTDLVTGSFLLQAF